MVLHVHGFVIEHHPGDNSVAATSGKILKSEISLNRPLLEHPYDYYTYSSCQVLNNQ